MATSVVDFDHTDRNSWFFGLMSRDETNSILQGERDSGVFLVRESTSIQGDYVLCVKEDNKVSHYIINRIQRNGTTQFKIGDQEFPDLESLLNFYKTHYLDTTSLIRPAPREQYVAKFEFAGRDPEDLPFNKGDILTIVTKDEDQWWTAKNSDGKTGLIPVPYVVKYDGKSSSQNSQTDPPPYTPEANSHNSIDSTQYKQRKLPARARVIQARVPNAYDRMALRLEVGDIITVTDTNVNGQWDGELSNGKKGYFPFTHVKFIESDEESDTMDSMT